MIISKARGFVFVHIPKTAGTSMMLALEGRAKKDDILIGDTPKAQLRKKRLKGLPAAGRLWKHSTLADIDGVLSAEEIDDMFCFTLVRNPWDRMVSYYHWLREQNFDHPAVALSKVTDFEAFLRTPDTVISIRNNPYSSYMVDARGIEKCDAYVRIEHFKKDMRVLEKHLGFNIKLGAYNSSVRNEDYRSYYDDDLAEFVGEMCIKDVVKFGYTF